MVSARLAATRHARLSDRQIERPTRPAVDAQPWLTVIGALKGGERRKVANAVSRLCNTLVYLSSVSHAPRIHGRHSDYTRAVDSACLICSC